MDGVGKARGEEERQEEDAGQQLGKQALELLYFPPLMTHVALVLFGGWIASRLELNLLFVFSLGFAYLCYVCSNRDLLPFFRGCDVTLFASPLRALAASSTFPN